MQQHVCTSKYLTLLLILFIKNYFSMLKCSQNCGNKSNSPIFKIMQILGCYIFFRDLAARPGAKSRAVCYDRHAGRAVQNAAVFSMDDACKSHRTATQLLYTPFSPVYNMFHVC
jgi:hypothetical protein